MRRTIITDVSKLKLPSDPIERWEVKEILPHLIDTAEAHYDKCLGLAANQIGYQKRLFVVKIDGNYAAFINPEIIVRKDGIKSDFETCLSFPDRKPVKVRRYKTIKMADFNIFHGIVARVIQHEIDHLNGVLI